jgi:site-specific recombinase XerD
MGKTSSFARIIGTYVLSCMAEGKSPKTIEWYSSNLKRFSHYLGESTPGISVEEIGVAEARGFIYHLQREVRRWEERTDVRDDKPLSAHSVQVYARTIKAFWSWLVAEGVIETNVMLRLKLPKVPRKVMPTFSREELGRMLSLPDRNTAPGFRDYVIVLVLLDTGIRLSELVTLEVGRIDFGQSCFLVEGEGGKERLVPFGTEVRRALRRYVGSYRPEPVHWETREVFLTVRGLPLKARGVQSMVTRLGERAGIVGTRCSPHTFRHTFARQYLMCGGDVFSLQRILGHTSLEVVKLYVNLEAGDIAQQHRKFSPVDRLRQSSLRGAAR